jgi:hypothetical protein
MVRHDVLARRTTALRCKLASLSAELSAWAVIVEKKEFALHTSQIALVCGGLEAMRGIIAKEIDEAAANGLLSLKKIEGFERKILAALQIWESYRTKFALRIEPSMRDVLALMDELAWEAYRPARNRAIASKAVAATEVREPPLVFPSASWSPFARSRERAYELDEMTGNLIDIGELQPFLDAMPVPVIGIPWYQLQHFPDAVFIGHEVGHLVEEDLHLEEALRKAILLALDKVPEERSTAWSRRWRSEVFADIYGVLVSGPAYAEVLLDVISADAQSIESERQPVDNRWSAYPTRTLRALVACETVRQLSAKGKNARLFVDAADALQTAWVAAYPKHSMPEYEGDVPKVVSGLLRTPLAAFATERAREGAPLTDVIAFDSGMETAARDDAVEANKRQAVRAENIRTLFAGVALAFLRGPDRFFAAEVQARFRGQLELKRKREVRKDVLVPGFKPASPKARHQATAEGLNKKFEKARPGEPPGTDAPPAESPHDLPVVD